MRVGSLRFLRGLLGAAPTGLLACMVAGCAGSPGGESTLPSAESAAVVATGAAAASALGVVDAASAWRYAAPLTLKWPKGAPAAGDLLVACTESQWQNTPATPAGWTSLYAASANQFGTALFYKIAAAGEPASVVFTIPQPYNVDAGMVRISGAAPVAPAWSHATNRGGATIATPGLVPKATGMLALACFAGTQSGAYSGAGGWNTLAHNAQYFSTLLEARQALTTDTSTAVNVATTAAAPASNGENDAYELLIGPATTGAPGAVSISPAAVAFTSVTAPARSVSVTQNGNTSFSASSQNCAAVATISAAGNGAFNVAPVGVGSCTFTLSGSAGNSAALPVTTTATSLKLH